MLATLIEWDQWLFGLVNGLWHHATLDSIMPYWRDKKTWIPLYVLLLVIVGKDRGLKTFWVLLILGLTIALADQVSSQWIKKSVERLRPCNDSELEGVRLLLDHCGGGYSFTSSHATNHFAIATQLYLLFRLTWKKQYFIALFIWAALIAYGQVYVGVHYPLDVFSGAFLGIAIAYFVHSISARLGFVKKIWN